MQIADLDINETSLREAIPGYIARKLQQRTADWRRSVTSQGWSGVLDRVDADAPGMIDKLEYHKELPPYLRIGALKPRSGSGNNALRIFSEADFPALIDFRNKSAILHFASEKTGVMSRIMQGYFIQLVCRLDPALVQCTVIDQRNFGSAFSLVGSALKSLKIITDRYGVDELFRSIPEELSRRNQSKGHAFSYLYEYNRTHRDSALPYHFILIDSYDDDLSEENKAMLAKMIANGNGAKAGIYLLIQHHGLASFDRLLSEHPFLPAISVQPSRQDGICIDINDADGLNTHAVAFAEKMRVAPDIDSPAALDRLVSLSRRHSETRQQESVKIALPTVGDWVATAWKKTSQDGLEAVIGKSRGQALNLRLGLPEIVHNALIGGAVGTGKTNLLHAIILQCLANYSPDELSLSLLDYKSGTEFSVYENIPHLYALSLGAGTKFGTDLLQHFQQELERRAELFKESGVTSLSAYRKKTGQLLARHLVVIDEFQVLLGNKRNGYIAQAALEDMIRRGRSFGFNFILSSQSLKDCTLSTPAKSNIGCRVCLRLSESDCSDFLSIENTVPATFSEVGQALYNNQEGRTVGNVEFRVAYYTDHEISDFCSLLAGQYAGKSTRPKAHLYRGNDRYLKATLPYVKKQGELLVCVEEGIPLVMHTLSLDHSKGPVMACGNGPLRVQFEANLQHEIRTRQVEAREVEGAELENFLMQAQMDSDSLQEFDVLLLKLNQRDSLNSVIQGAVSQLILTAPCKVVLFAETPVVLRNLYLDRNTAEFLICFDQRSYADFGFGGELAGQSQAAAMFYPGEQDAVIVKIPLINPQD